MRRFAAREEILTGALPSAKDGTIVVETTWRGGRGGHLWDIVKTALETPEERKQPDDWRVVFFPWQDDPAYCDAEPRPLTQETLAVFLRQARIQHRTNVVVSTSARSIRHVHQARVSDGARGVLPDSN